MNKTIVSYRAQIVMFLGSLGSSTFNNMALLNRRIYIVYKLVANRCNNTVLHCFGGFFERGNFLSDYVIVWLCDDNIWPLFVKRIVGANFEANFWGDTSGDTPLKIDFI